MITPLTSSRCDPSPDVAGGGVDELLDAEVLGVVVGALAAWVTFAVLAAAWCFRAGRRRLTRAGL